MSDHSHLVEIWNPAVSQNGLVGSYGFASVNKTNIKICSKTEEGNKTHSNTIVMLLLYQLSLSEVRLVVTLSVIFHTVLHLLPNNVWQHRILYGINWNQLWELPVKMDEVDKTLLSTISGRINCFVHRTHGKLLYTMLSGHKIPHLWKH